MPVVTYAENRYEQYPAYMENFDDMKVGEFDFNAAAPLGCWEVKKDKSATAKVEANGKDKVLAMTGTYSLKLKSIMGNITAGDSYAENQAWQIDVTVPANMASDAEIVLLDIHGSKAKPEAGGFKIAGGKMYYDKAGEYVELAGVDVSKGGKFTLKRSLDFNKEDAFTSDYAVYDATGKLLAEVKDVAIATIKLPVQKLGLSVTKLTEAVKLDNLKLYANGVGADFELYNAKTGIEYTDLETAKDSNTAYRLSWMNATKYEKVYSVVATFGNGEEKVIETIKMAPGTDGVATGIVEVASGQTVKLVARNDSQPEPDAPNQGNTGKDTPKKNGDDSTLLLVVVIAAAVVFALIVVGIILVLKKKPTPAAEEK